jgi:hypothetical protein
MAMVKIYFMYLKFNLENQKSAQISKLVLTVVHMGKVMFHPLLVSYQPLKTRGEDEHIKIFP